jgi:hypothetical protein
MHTQPLIERGEEQKQTTTVLNPFIQSGDGVVNKLGVVLVRDLLVGAANEDVAVDEASEAAADERADPVDPVSGEVARGDGGAEGAGGVHGAAAEGPRGEDVGADDEADGDGRDGAERALLGVGGGGVHGVDEREGDDDLEHDALQLADARGDGVRGDGLAVGDESEEQARHGGAQQLGHPVEDARQDGDVAAHGQPERHGRVQVAARDVRRDGHAHEQRQRVRDRDRHQARRVQRAAIRQLPCAWRGQVIVQLAIQHACIETALGGARAWLDAWIDGTGILRTTTTTHRRRWRNRRRRRRRGGWR